MRRTLGVMTWMAALAFVSGCQETGVRPVSTEDRMNTIAQSYVKLVLAVGQHDADYVDAYYGPPEWRNEAEAARTPLNSLLDRARQLSAQAAGVPPPTDDLERLRHSFLRRQLEAVAARLRMLQGERLLFDEESRA